MEVHVFTDAAAVLRPLAAYLVAAGQQALARQGRFTVALSGGSSPKKLYELLAAEFRTALAWSEVTFFFGDERYVPSTDPDSNYRMANEALFAPLGVRPEQVFAVDTSLPPAQAAAQYAAAIEQHFHPAPPRFDLVLLGLGADAHTASLFPHTPVLQAAAASVESVFLADKQTHRITLTAPLLNQAHAVAFLAFGVDKAAAVQQVLAGPPDPARLPAQLVRPTDGELHWFLDAAAASQLPPRP